MARPDKAAAVAELTDAFRDSSAAVLTEYRGLTVAQLKELRRSLAPNATYAVVKNTLTKIAAREAGVDAFESLLEGPSAIAFVKGDPVDVAKSLRDFGKNHPLLVIKGGLLEGRAISADDVRKLADLESREVLLSKLAGAMLASLSKAVGTFAAPLSQMARLLAALEEKAKADPSVLAGAAGTAAEPEAAAAEAEAPAAEAEAPAAEPEASVAEAPAAEPEAPAAEAEAPAAEAEPEAEATAAEAATEDNAPTAEADVADGETSTSEATEQE
ncbi:MAG: 50S ribosomal protein L10 [Frankiaceae bacterium]|nr:50S ribosomal protein L10 [Frankiaceae bacterium]